MVARFFEDEAYVAIFNNDSKACSVPVPVEQIGQEKLMEKDLLSGEIIPLQFGEEGWIAKVKGKGAWVLKCGQNES